MDAAISLDNLTVSYRRHPALHHVNGSFARGSLTAIVGPNGAGKSTLLKSMLGLVPCNDGRVHTHVDARRIAYLPQQAEIDRSFPINVLDCVLLGYWQAKGNWGGIDAAMRARAIQALANMAVTVNLFPVTGVTLPLVSMGGTSFIFTCLAIGIVLSVARNVEQQEGQNEATANA